MTLAAPRLVLASASPRRQRLIGWLGVTADIRPIDLDEDLSSGEPPTEIARSLALAKARAAAEVAAPDELCLGFDTVVVLDGAVLGKPATDDEAREMLAALSGRAHDVVTGVSLAGHGFTPVSFSVTTRVRMRDLSGSDVEVWLARGEHLGCAGAYNIEHHLAEVTEDECYQNVAGLPLCHVYATLAGGDRDRFPGLAAPVARCDETLRRSCRLGPVLCGLSGASSPRG